jgi:hypothetical protein
MTKVGAQLPATGAMRRPWWWNDPETRAWIASGACGCRACKRDRKLLESDPGCELIDAIGVTHG